MSLRRLIRSGALGLAGALALAMPFAFAPAASAEPTVCTQRIYDEGNFLTSRMPDVQQGADKLAALGYDVHVVTTNAIAEPNYQQHLAVLLASCPSWQAPPVPGDRKLYYKSNFLMLSFGVIPDVTKKSGFYRPIAISVGEQLNGLLKDSGESDRIISQEMIPTFQTKDYAGATVAGLTRLHSVIGSYLTVPPPDTQTEPPASSNPEPPATREPQPRQEPQQLQPVSSGSSLPWGAILVGLIVLVVLAAGGFGLRYLFVVYLPRKKEEEREQAASYAAAIKAQAEAEQAINDLELTTLPEVLKGQADEYAETGARGVAIKAAYEEYVAALQLAKDKRDEGNTRADLTDTDLDEAEYDACTELFEAAKTAVATAIAANTAMDTLIVNLKAEIAGFSATVENRQMLSGNVGKLVEDLTAEGYQLGDIATRYATAKTDLASYAAKADTGEGLGLLPVIDDLNELMTRLQQIKADAMALTALRARVGQAIADLQTRLNEANTGATAAAEAFDRVKAGFNEVCWTSEQQKGEQAKAILTQVTTDLAAIKLRADMDHQEWTAAEADITLANTTLADAEALSQEWVDLEASLIKTRDEAPVKATAQRTKLDGIRGYIKKHRQDIDDGPGQQLDSAYEVLDQADQMLVEVDEGAKAPKPDYPAFAALLTQCSEAAKVASANATKQYEAAEALRQRAAQAIRDADAAITAAERYISSVSEDVDAHARNLLATAREELETASRANTPDGQITQAGVARSTANSAKSSAEGDHRREQAKRDELERIEQARLAAIAAQEAAEQRERERQEAEERREREREEAQERAEAAAASRSDDGPGGDTILEA